MIFLTDISELDYTIKFQYISSNCCKAVKNRIKTDGCLSLGHPYLYLHYRRKNKHHSYSYNYEFVAGLLTHEYRYYYQYQLIRPGHYSL